MWHPVPTASRWFVAVGDFKSGTLIKSWSRLKMDGFGVKKLLDPGVFRVFLSSPFNGMEEEREELTRKYWPQLQSACSRAGVTFVPVDMRWGITSDQSTGSQTINICLQEIDRSDVFVGFFGQRYGWHGLNDAALQATFEAAMPRYPWLEKYRDRSVTELEFLHGHLNDPGKLPAILCFRDKEYDDKLCAEGLAKADSRQVYKYSAENKTAAKRMQDLMKQVKETESKCLGIHMAYPSPKEGACWMFEKMWEYLVKMLKTPSEKKQTKRELELQQHEMFLAKMSALYHDGGNCSKKMDELLFQDGCQKLVVIGQLGVGKSALLCNWVHKHVKKDPKKIWFYHFVGCTAESSNPHNIMRRVIWALRHEIDRIQVGADYIEVDYPEMDRMGEDELIGELHKWIKKVAELNHQVVFVVDGLQKIQYESKLSRPLSWLPKNIPKNIHVILSTDITDILHTEELEKEHRCMTLTVQPLSVDVLISLCKDTLKIRGKTLSENQLQRIITAKQTSNALFLKIILEELCMFGKFRELDQKIDSLVSCDSISSCFGKFLERLEQDYDSSYSNGSLTAKIMSALYVSRKGLTENEISELYSIESHQWLPFYYAAEPHIHRLNGGFLKLMHEPLGTAIYDRYIQTDDRRKEHQQQQIMYYKSCIESMKITETAVPSHFYTELLWLCHQCEDMARLKELVTTIPVFLKLFRLEPYQLLKYVNSLEMTNEILVEEFSRAIDLHAVHIYSERTEEDLMLDFNVGEELISVLETVAQFFNMARSLAEEHFLLRLKNILENNDRVKNRDVRLHVALYKLACFYVDIKEENKALPYHESALDFFKNKAPQSAANLEHLSRSYHGTGTAYMKTLKFQEAIDCFEKSMEINRSFSNSERFQRNISQSLSCIAEVYSQQKNFQQACEKYEEVITMEESIYASYLPPEASYSLSNLGICYRRLKLFDKAEDVYRRALKIKLNALGDNHVDVGYAYFSLGNLAYETQKPEEALDHFERTLEIFKNVNYLESIDTVFVRENIAQVYMMLNDKEKGLPYYWAAFAYLEKHKKMDVGDGNVHLNYLRHILGSNDYAGTWRVARAMVRCDKMQHFLPYLFLDYVNRLFLSIDPATEPYEESIEHGIELFPDNINLPFQRIELNLVPNRNLEAINSTLQFYYKHAKDSDGRLIAEAARLCHKAAWQEGVTSLCEFWSQERPDFREFLQNLSSELQPEE